MALWSTRHAEIGSLDGKERIVNEVVGLETPGQEGLRWPNSLPSVSVCRLLCGKVVREEKIPSRTNA
jgi:hypothetical protein